MSNYDTLNPVPSLDPRDLDDNATVFDDLLNSTASSVPDRLGVLRKTWHQVELDAQALISPNVSALAGLTLSANKGLYATGSGALATYTLNAFNRTLGATADGPAFRSAIGAIGSADNITGGAGSLTTSRSISATGDATWSVNFNGTANATGALTLAASGVSAGTYGSVTVNAKGLVTAAVTVTPIANGGTGLPAQAFTAFTLQNGWTVSSGRRAAYRKVVDNVQIEMHITGNTVADGTVLATLPAGFRPVSLIGIPVLSGFKNTPSATVAGPSVDIATDGTIKCYGCNGGSGGIIFFSALIPLV